MFNIGDLNHFKIQDKTTGLFVSHFDYGPGFTYLNYPLKYKEPVDFTYHGVKVILDKDLYQSKVMFYNHDAESWCSENEVGYLEGIVYSLVSKYSSELIETGNIKNIVNPYKLVPFDGFENTMKVIPPSISGIVNSFDSHIEHTVINRLNRNFYIHNIKNFFKHDTIVYVKFNDNKILKSFIEDYMQDHKVLYSNDYICIISVDDVEGLVYYKMGEQNSDNLSVDILSLDNKQNLRKIMSHK